jgi:hypothetical protein
MRIKRLRQVWFNPDTLDVILQDPLPEDRQKAECRAMEQRYWFVVGEEAHEPPYTHLIGTHPSGDPKLGPWWLAQIEETDSDWPALPLKA